jgi:ArsR family transcriptional regulator
MQKEVKILKALANEKRLEILKLLEKNPGQSVVEIAEEINLHFKSTSKHLQRLSEAGLVKSNRDGVWVRFAPTEKVDQLLKKISSF